MSTPRLPSGILTAALTPFHDDLTLNERALVEHTQWLLSNGSNGVLLFGTTGEGLSLTVEERLAGLKAVLAADVTPERLLVTTSALATPDAIRLTRNVVQSGVGGVLVMPPFHFRNVTTEGIYRFYDQLIQSVGSSDLRLYFYHFPELSRIPIPFDVIEELNTTYPAQIAGIKDSSGEWDHTEALCRAFPDLQVFPGTERLLLPALQAGGAGCISATTNLTASLAGEVWTAWNADRNAEALHETLNALQTAFAPLPTVSALKYVIARVRDDPEWTTTRPPLAPLKDDEAATVQDIVPRLQSEVDLPGPISS